MKGVLFVDGAVRAEKLNGDEVAAADAECVPKNHQKWKHDDSGDHARNEKVLHRIRGQGLERVDLFGHAHRSDFRRHRRADAAGYHESDQNRRQLAQHRERDRTADEILRVHAMESAVGLEREHHPGEHCRQKNDGH